MIEEEENLRLASLHENACFRTYRLRKQYRDIYGLERIEQARVAWEEAQTLFRLAYKVVQQVSGYERANAVANGARR